MLVAGLSGGVVGAQEPLQGAVSGRLTAAAGPYLVANDVVVPAGETLILDAGVELRFQDTNDGLIVRGALVANGTAGAPIRFTSDDAVKERGQWQGIVFESTSDAAASVFNHCIVEAAGNFGSVALLIDRVSPRIADCRFVQSFGYGIRLAGSRAQIHNCQFEENGGFAIAMDALSFPILESNGATSNGRDAIEIFGGVVSASGIWDASELPYTITNDVTVGEGATLTIQAGATVEFQDTNDALLVAGALRAVGSVERPILFTSDNEEKAPGQWEAIRILNTADAETTRLEDCVIEFGGNFGAENLSIDGVAATVVRCELRTSFGSGIRLVNSDAIIQSCRFENNRGFAMFMDPASFPTTRDSVAEGNGRDAIGIGGGAVAEDGLWVRDAIPYTVTDDVTILEGVRLTIEAGTTVEFQDTNDALICRGALVAEGTSGSPIVFTSEEALKAPGQWEGLRFFESVDTAATRLTWCVIEAGGNFGSENVLIQGTSFPVVDCVVRLSNDHGLRLADSSARVETCRFEDNRGFAMFMDPASFPLALNNSGAGNGRNAIGIAGGVVSEGGQWSRDELPYTITNDLSVADGATLTLVPGTTIEFQDTNDGLFVGGALIANGSVEAPITFTSDNEGKEPGQWEGLRFLASVDTSKTIVRHCVFEAGGNFGSENVLIEGTSIPVVDSVFRLSNNHGLRLANSNARVESCDFDGNRGFAVFMDTASFPLVDGNTGVGNGRNAIGIAGGSVIENGTWSVDSLPYTITDDITVAEGVILTIEPGTVVEFQDTNDGLIINGALVAAGAVDHPILWTSDDVEKAPGQWQSLIFTPLADGASSLLEYCEFEAGGNFAAETLSISEVDVLVRNCQFRRSNNAGVRLFDSDAEILDCLFEENLGFAISMDPVSSPELRNNRASGNGADAIEVRGGAMDQLGAWTRDAIPYQITDDVTITSEGKLTLEPGVTVQFRNTNDGLFVDGALIARGTRSQRIRFISDEDEGAPGQWESIRFNDSSRDDLCALVYCDIESGGNFGSVAVVCQNSRPTIERTRIRGNFGVGLVCDGASVALSHMRFESNTGLGLLTRNGAAPVVRSSVFLANAGGAARNEDTSLIVDAQNNYWGDPTGPLDTRDDDGLGLLNEESEGGAVSEFIDWSEPLVTEPEDEPASGALSISPGMVEFPETVVGSTTRRVVEVQNVGDGIASIVGLSVIGNGFDVDSLSAPIELAAGESVGIEIRFEPNAVGSFAGTLIVETTAENGPVEVSLAGVGSAGGGSEPGDFVRVSASAFDDFGPAWDPSSERIAFLTRRPPAVEPVSNIAWVMSDGSREALIAVGDNSGFGIGNSLSWMGSTGRLVTEERIVFHEYMSFQPEGSLVTRSVSDGDDASFTRELLIDGGGGGVMIRVSRDGETALWRFSDSGGSGLTSIRSAPLSSLDGQSARAIGEVHIEENVANPEQRFVSGAALAPDGSWFVISEVSGTGLDLFVYMLDGSGSRRQLTFSGAEEGARNVFPDVAPDGRTIAFGFQSGVEGARSDIYTIDVDASNLQNVTRSTELSETFPSWAPDGRRLAFQRFDSEASGALGAGEAPNWNIYVLALDGSPGGGVESGFASDADGWTVVGDAQGGSAIPDYVAEGGNPGGHLCADDNVAGGVWYWNAPDRYLGNQSAAYNGRLVFDLKQSSTSNQFDGQDLVLVGSGVTLVYDTENNPGTDWTRYEVVLNEASGWRVGALDGPEPSRETFVAVLGSLEALRIRGEYRSGADRGCLDNVALIYGSGSIGDAPELRIVREGSQARLIWNVTAPAYRLQSREFLDARTPWSDVTVPPVERDGRFEVVAPIDQMSRFFQVVP